MTMSTEEADRLHTLTVRAVLPFELRHQSVKAFHLYQFRDAEDRRTPSAVELAEAAALLRETALMAQHSMWDWGMEWLH